MVVRIIIRSPRIVFDDYRLLRRHYPSDRGEGISTTRILHRLNHVCVNALLMQVDHVLHCEGLHHPRAVDVIDDQLRVDAGAGHGQYFRRGSSALIHLTAELGGDFRAVSCVDVIKRCADSSAGHCSDACSDERAGACVTCRMADEGTDPATAQCTENGAALAVRSRLTAAGKPIA